MKINKKLAFLMVCGLMGLASCGGAESNNSPSGLLPGPSVPGSLPGTSVPGISTPISTGGGDSSTSTPVTIAVSVSGPTTVDSGGTITLAATVTGSDNHNVVWTSSSEATASISQTGVIVASNVAVDTNVTFRATSAADNTKYGEHTVLVKKAPDVDMTATVQITDFNNLDDVKTSIVEATGAYRVKVNVENLPAGKTLADCTFTYPHNSALVTYIADNADTPNVAQFIAGYAGSEKVEVKVVCGDKTAVASMNFEITKDASKYTPIGTAADLLALFKLGNIQERYELTSNIDLNGYVTTAAVDNLVFNGVLDGNGYTISNFVAACGNDGTGGGIFGNIARGIIKNTHFSGKVNAPIGWGGLLAKEIQFQSIIENCLFEAENISAVNDPSGSGWSWQRNGAIAGVLKGTLHNVVSVATSTSEDNLIKSQMISTVPYAYSNGLDGFATMENVYTNNSKDLAVPFDASGINEYGMVGNDFFDEKLTLGLGAFDATAAADFNLPTTIWTLADGQMPHLAHFGETANVLAPSATATADIKTLEIGGTATITAGINYTSETPTYSYAIEEGKADIISVAAGTEPNKFVVTGLAAGTAKVTITATIGSETYDAEAINFKVNGSDGPTYEVPDNAIEITTAAQLWDIMKLSPGESSAYAERNFVLMNDIDFSEITTNKYGFEGVQYKGIIEGQGHSILNYTSNTPMFHFMYGTIRNLTLEGTWNGAAGGFLAYENNGSIENVTVTVEINNAINTFAMIAMVSGANASYVGCHTNIVVNATGCNTLYPICQDDASKSIENCSYSLSGTADDLLTNGALIITGNTNITKK